MLDPRLRAAIGEAVDRRLGSIGHRPLILGLCGAQGSGKSTIAAALARRWTGEGRRVAVLSIDDLYLTKAERAGLARSVHPLFATRGPPGTHDIALGLDVLDRLAQGEAAPLPRFDKAADDRLPREAWDRAPANTDILILEGWCVGAQPQPDAALVEPVNRLEREEDQEGVWRRHANDALAGDYQQLFGRLDLLVLLAAPDFAVVERWRTEQEVAARASGKGGMRGAAIGRFVQHYERLTRDILATMPGYADLVIRLDGDRGVRAVEPREN